MEFKWAGLLYLSLSLLYLRMKPEDRGVVLCILVLFSLVWDCECHDTLSELSERPREEEKAGEQKQLQTQTFTGGGENSGQNENPDPQTDPHR